MVDLPHGPKSVLDLLRVACSMRKASSIASSIIKGQPLISSNGFRGVKRSSDFQSIRGLIGGDGELDLDYLMGRLHCPTRVEEDMGFFHSRCEEYRGCFTIASKQLPSEAIGNASATSFCQPPPVKPIFPAIETRMCHGLWPSRLLSSATPSSALPRPHSRAYHLPANQFPADYCRWHAGSSLSDRGRKCWRSPYQTVLGCVTAHRGVSCSAAEDGDATGQSDSRTSEEASHAPQAADAAGNLEPSGVAANGGDSCEGGDGDDSDVAEDVITFDPAAEQLSADMKNMGRLRKRTRFPGYGDDIEMEIEEEGWEPKPGEFEHLYDARGMVERWLEDEKLWGVVDGKETERKELRKAWLLTRLWSTRALVHAGIAVAQRRRRCSNLRGQDLP